MLSFPPFRLDIDEERLWKGNTQLTLRRKPFAILRHLVANPRRVVTHEELLQHVWGGTVVSESALRSHLHELRQVLGEGVIETVIGRGYRFVAELVDPGGGAGAGPGVGPATAAAAATLAPVVDRSVVGRAGELAVLTAALERALTGHRQLCFVTGEPGIGKTTLVDTFLATLDARKVPAVRGHSIEQYGTPEAYLAVIEILGRLRQSERGDQMLAALVRFAPSFAVQVPHLIPDAQLDDVTRRARAGGEARMARELIEALEAVCTTQPLVIVLEDLQWSDVATIDLLALLGQRRERAQLLVIATSRRAEAQTVTHPLNRVMRSLVARSGAVAVPLERIEHAEVRRFLDLRFPDHAFPDAFVDVIDRITGGTPLFLVSILDDLASRGMIDRRDGRWALTLPIDEVAAHRPESVRQLLDVQLDRLEPAEQRVLEAASVIGPEFATGLVAAALELPVEQVDDVCDGLARRSMFLLREASEDWPDGTVQTRYRVTHALVQEVGFDRCAPTRRQRWHRLIAERLDAAYGDRAAEVSHILATHYEQGQVLARALHYYVVAGERTALRWSLVDASRLFRRALSLLQRMPENAERDALELRILVGISQAVILSSDETKHEPITLFERMIAIARRLGDVPQLYAALVNLSFRCSTLADYQRATAIAAELDDLARTSAISPKLLVFAECARGLCEMWKGDLAAAFAVLERLTDPTVAAYGPMGILGSADRLALNLIFIATVRWVRGEPDRAIEDCMRGIEQATRSADPYTLGAGYTYLARLRYWRRESPAAIRDAAERVPVIPEAEVWHPQAILLAAAARSQEAALPDGEIEDLIRLFRTRTTAFPMGCTALGIPIVDILRRAGQLARAAAMVEEMLVFARAHGEHLLEAELIRLRGELVEPTDPTAAADAYLEAIAVARRWSARALELRAAIRLAQLWPDRAPARDHLAAAVAPFTEGDATADLIEARRLLASAAKPV